VINRWDIGGAASSCALGEGCTGAEDDGYYGASQARMKVENLWVSFASLLTPYLPELTRSHFSSLLNLAPSLKWFTCLPVSAAVLLLHAPDWALLYRNALP
jgi:hypothetical protein